MKTVTGQSDTVHAVDLSPERPVLELARDIVESVVWSMVTTVGADGRPRMRLLHPVWFWGGDEPMALIGTRPTALKRAHLAANPVLSCSYWSPAHHHTVVVDADAAWLPASDHADAWARIASVPEPMGYDPAPIWPNGPGGDGFAVIVARPFRITARPAGQSARVWTRPMR